MTTDAQSALRRTMETYSKVRYYGSTYLLWDRLEVGLHLLRLLLPWLYLLR